MDTSKFDAPTKKYYKKHPIMFSIMKKAKGDQWWFWDADNQRWDVGTVYGVRTDTFVVGLNLPNGTINVPIYKLFMSKPTEDAIYKRKEIVNIAGGVVQDKNLGVKTDLKF